MTLETKNEVNELISNFNFEIETRNLDWDGDIGEDRGSDMLYDLSKKVSVSFDYSLTFNELNAKYHVEIDNLLLFIYEERYILTDRDRWDIEAKVQNTIINQLNN